MKGFSGRDKLILGSNSRKKETQLFRYQSGNRTQVILETKAWEGEKENWVTLKKKRRKESISL